MSGPKTVSYCGSDGTVIKARGNTLRFVCLSGMSNAQLGILEPPKVTEDTHGRHNEIKNIPDGDVLIHAGDFTDHGLEEEVNGFNNFLAGLPHKHKVVISGNHDLTMDLAQYEKIYTHWTWKTNGQKLDAAKIRSLLTNCTYIQDAAVEIEGIKIFGSPWSPATGNYVFGYELKEAKKVWSVLPSPLPDILITHGPPKGIGDLNAKGENAGCPVLLDILKRAQTKPLIHVFGHIHAGYGIHKNIKAVPKTTFVNASITNAKMKVVNTPVVFDISW